LHTPISFHTIHRSLPTSFPIPEKRKRDRKRRAKKKDWTPSTITPGHLQKLMKHGFMAVAELEPCCVVEDPTFPAPTEGYMVSFVAFYEWGFGTLPHRFLHSLLWYYGLELHHLTPSGVLHIAAFMTLCEAYLEINPELDLWKYFFCVWRLQDHEAVLTISRGVVIHVKTTPLLCSLCLPVAAPFPCLLGAMEWLGRTSTSCNHCVRTFSSCSRRG
jgi:hypothetical protein